MISHPTPGQRVRIHYRAALRDLMPNHGKTGAVLFPARGRRCRNHAVQLDNGQCVAVPAGNLQKA